MLKDPNHQQETPYELLGLTPDASAEEVHKALPRFMRDRRNIPRLGKATEAVKRLKNARERAEIDIWFYEIEAMEATGSSNGLASAPLALEEFTVVPCWPAESLDSDLESPPPQANLEEITFLRPKITDLKRFDGWDASAIRPVVDG